MNDSLCFWFGFRVTGQSTQFCFCNALAAKIFSTNKLPVTHENEIKLQFVFFGAGSLLRYDFHEDTELIIDIITALINLLVKTYS